MSKDTKQLILIAAMAAGAFIVLRKTSAGTAILRPVGTYPTAAPQPGTAAYAQWLAQQQAQLVNGQNNALNSIGRLIGGIFSGSGSTSSGTVRTTASGSPVPGGVTEIANDDVPGQAGYGWRYFSDGTAIGPDGSYYSNGTLVYTPTDSSATNTPNNDNLMTSADRTFLYSDYGYGN